MTVSIKDVTGQVLEHALSQAFLLKLPIVLASTTGRTAERFGCLMETTQRCVPALIVYHPDSRVPEEWRFDSKVKAKLSRQGIKIIPDSVNFLPPLGLVRWIEKHFKFKWMTVRERELESRFGAEGRVCYKLTEIAAQTGWAQKGDSLVVLAGRRQGLGFSAVVRILESKPLDVELSGIYQPDGRRNGN
jgi:hypothetical protein